MEIHKTIRKEEQCENIRRRRTKEPATPSILISEEIKEMFEEYENWEAPQYTERKRARPLKKLDYVP